MLIAYQVVEDVYQGLHGIEEIGLFSFHNGSNLSNRYRRVISN